MAGNHGNNMNSIRKRTSASAPNSTLRKRSKEETTTALENSHGKYVCNAIINPTDPFDRCPSSIAKQIKKAPAPGRHDILALSIESFPSSQFDLLDDNLCEEIISFCDFHSTACAWRTCHRLKEISDRVLSPFDVLDDNLREALLSFCDFNSAVCAGRTCKHLKEVADRVLDKWADKVILGRLPIASNEWDSSRLRAISIRRMPRVSDERSELKNGWTPAFRTKSALINTALVLGSITDTVDQAKARHLFWTRGRIHVLGTGRIPSIRVLDDIPKEYRPDEEGFTMAIRFVESYPLRYAVKFIRGSKVCGKACGPNDELLKHAMFCFLRKGILRKNKPLRLKFATYESVQRHSGRTIHYTMSSLMIKVNNRKFELYSRTKDMWPTMAYRVPQEVISIDSSNSSVSSES